MVKRQVRLGAKDHVYHVKEGLGKDRAKSHFLNENPTANSAQPPRTHPFSFVYSHAASFSFMSAVPHPSPSRSRNQDEPHLITPRYACPPLPSGMDEGPRLAGEPAPASSSASSSGSRASRPRKGVRLRPLRRRRGPATAALASQGGDGEDNGGGAAQDDLALPLGMSFAAVLARVRALPAGGTR